MSSSRSDGQGASVIKRRTRKTYANRALGNTTPRLVEVAGVGRNSRQHYCETCGRKLSVCRCGRDLAA